MNAVRITEISAFCVEKYLRKEKSKIVSPSNDFLIISLFYDLSEEFLSVSISMFRQPTSLPAGDTVGRKK